MVKYNIQSLVTYTDFNPLKQIKTVQIILFTLFDKSCNSCKINAIGEK